MIIFHVLSLGVKLVKCLNTKHFSTLWLIGIDPKRISYNYLRTENLPFPTGFISNHLSQFDTLANQIAVSTYYSSTLNAMEDDFTINDPTGFSDIPNSYFANQNQVREREGEVFFESELNIETQLNINTNSYQIENAITSNAKLFAPIPQQYSENELNPYFPHKRYLDFIVKHYVIGNCNVQ